LSYSLGNPQVRYELADVSRQASIRALAERWQGPLHVLVNDAAATPRTRQETPEGTELQWATNVLGYFWMIQGLPPVHAGYGRCGRLISRMWRI
jgi:NAD(P)-dependent dehydrogenase (short-subunit alcohol dehydrogenase family)